jgi:hypothetical protein
MDTKSKRDLAINQVPITTNPLLNELLHRNRSRSKAKGAWLLTKSQLLPNRRARIIEQTDVTQSN